MKPQGLSVVHTLPELGASLGSLFQALGSLWVRNLSLMSHLKLP